MLARFALSGSRSHPLEKILDPLTVRRMNEVNARRARLVPVWVTVFGRVYHLCM